jgi:hypothetical protein
MLHATDDEMGKPKGGGGPLGRTRHRKEDNIRMDLQEIGWSDMHWIKLVQYRDQWKVTENMAMNFEVE